MIKKFSKIYKNTLFRLSLLGALLFVLSLMVVAVSVYYVTVTAELNRIDKLVETEHSEIQKIYDESGFQAVEREVTLRTASSEGLYGLVNKRVAIGNLFFQEVTKEDGNLPLLTGLQADEFNKVAFLYSNPHSEENDFKDRRARALVGPIRTGNGVAAILIVGRDVEGTMRIGLKVRNAILISSCIALILGLISSWFLSKRFTRRVDAFNKLADDVRSGNLNRRAPRNYSHDEMDLLAEHLNEMLDHIERLMQSMKYAGDSVAHDLKTPLTRLRTRLESAGIERHNTQDAEIFFSAAEDANELLKTFDNILRISRLKTGERRELLIDINPKILLDDLADLYEPSCENAGLEFHAFTTEGHIIRADRGLLSQAVSNLIENAIKYTPKGGIVRLELLKNNIGSVEISVCDNGLGIPLEDRERVKGRFVRLDKSRTHPGNGLGLSLVDAVANFHNADFTISSIDDNNSKRPGLKAAIIFPKKKIK